MNKKLGLLLALLSLAGAGLVRAGAEHQHIGHQHAGHEHAGHQHVGHRHGGHHHGRMSKHERAALIAKYHDVRKAEHEHDVASGMYADLYKSPAWPTAAQFFENKDFFNVSSFYNYAQDCYDSKGYSSGSNITRLFFGEERNLAPRDLFLASKLVEDGKAIINIDSRLAVPTNKNANPNDDAGTLSFIGRTETYGLHFDFVRYLIAKSLACGIELPVLYRRNKLRSKQLDDADNTPANIQLRNGLEAKGFAGQDAGFLELGGSAAGLGDVAMFLNGQFDSKHFDKLVTGVRIQFPTGKKASQFKIWAPDLGNGGFSEIAAYTNMVVSYKQCLNPHLSIQGGFSLPAHVDRRIPKKLTITVDRATARQFAINTLVAKGINTITGGPGASEAPELVTYGTAVGIANGPAAIGAVANRVAAGATDAPNIADTRTKLGLVSGFQADIKTAIGKLGSHVPISTVLAADQKLALADKSSVWINSAAITDEYDSQVNNMGDTVTTVKMIRGPELKVRLGNMVEHCFMRRGFLDMFYDLRIKGRDYISGVSADDFNIELLRKNSYQVEHRLGLDYSYQFDLFTRARLGLAYTVAGKNVPKALDLSGSLNCAF